ncbi:MAG TPA: multicopper oxidase domain-containing protein [Gemmatimonadaceae bacterium]|nr:multicopper oxidase domain-containing protein [Gemmatimonadaceae bacterium]
MLFSLLIAIGTTWSSCSALPSPPRNAALANDNRLRAGTLHGGVLTVRIVAGRAAWRPDGPSGCALGVHAFAEEGKPATIPGPLIRVWSGTKVRVTVRNALSTPLWVRGLQDRAAGNTLDSTEVPPGQLREFRFVAATRGAWHYWAGAVGARVPTSDADGQLVGALVVDSWSGTARPPEDRVLVLTRWNPTGSSGNDGFQLNAFNGRSWPNTERLAYTVNDSVRWHLINASNTAHEMHLHGFFFRIDRRGFAIDSAFPTLPVAARMRVTTVMRPGEWEAVAWIPDRPGNWLFHCHLLTHMNGAQRLDRMAETETTANERDHATDAIGAHAEHDMGGLVMALDIKPSPTAAAAPALPRRERVLDLYAQSRPNRFGDRPGYGFIVQEGAAAPAADSIRIPGTPLLLKKGEPLRITVHNRLTMPISVHWHGIELDSYFDGVGGFSGAGQRIAPMIAAGDSFIVRFTPPRAGTYMYHVHGERGEQLASGLYAPLIVTDSTTPFDPRTEPIFAFADGGPGANSPIFINGSASPDTVELVAGTRYRIRMIFITANDVLMMTLRGPSGLPLARSFGLDAAENPNATLRPVQYPTGPGHTRDVAITFDSPGDYSLIAQRATGGSTTTVPIRVRWPRNREPRAEPIHGLRW